MIITRSVCSSVAADWTEVKVAEQWVWLGLLQALATAPRGLLDPVVKQATELDFASEEVFIGAH